MGQVWASLPVKLILIIFASGASPAGKQVSSFFQG